MKIEIFAKYLYISDEGTRTDLTAAVNGTEKIAEAANKYDRRRVLLDYRKVHYDVPLTEAYNLVKVFENKVPEYKNLVMAVVVDNRDWEIAKFWESISVKRGYSFRLFQQMAEAKNWLTNAEKSRQKEEF